MQQQDLPISVQNLFQLGVEGIEQNWLDYREKGIRPEHIPALISVVDRTRELWDEYDAFDEDPEGFAPIHAWRALAQLQALEALPALMNLLNHVEDIDADILQEELPTVYGMLGPGAVPDLTAYIKQGNQEHGMWALLCVGEGLKNIAEAHPETRAEIVNTLTGALRGYDTQDATYNAFLADFLMDLKAVEAAPLVEAAFQAEMIEESILGDWEDFQVGVGLLEKRLTPPRKFNHDPLFFSDGLEPDPEEIKLRQHQQRDKKKEKNKRSQAKASRAKNRKKKKKK